MNLQRNIAKNKTNKQKTVNELSLLLLVQTCCNFHFSCVQVCSKTLRFHRKDIVGFTEALQPIFSKDGVVVISYQTSILDPFCF